MHGLPFWAPFAAPTDGGVHHGEVAKDALGGLEDAHCGGAARGFGGAGGDGLGEGLGHEHGGRVAAANDLALHRALGGAEAAVVATFAVGGGGRKGGGGGRGGHGGIIVR